MIRVKAVTAFPGGPVAKNLPANAGGTGSIPGLGRSRSYEATKPVLCTKRILPISIATESLHVAMKTQAQSKTNT